MDIVPYEPFEAPRAPDKPLHRSPSTSVKPCGPHTARRRRLTNTGYCIIGLPIQHRLLQGTSTPHRGCARFGHSFAPEMLEEHSPEHLESSDAKLAKVTAAEGDVQEVLLDYAEFPCAHSNAAVDNSRNSRKLRDNLCERKRLGAYGKIWLFFSSVRAKSFVADLRPGSLSQKFHA